MNTLFSGPLAFPVSVKPGDCLALLDGKHNLRECARGTITRKATYRFATITESESDSGTVLAATMFETSP